MYRARDRRRTPRPRRSRLGRRAGACRTASRQHAIPSRAACGDRRGHRSLLVARVLGHRRARCTARRDAACPSAPETDATPSDDHRPPRRPRRRRGEPTEPQADDHRGARRAVHAQGRRSPRTARRGCESPSTGRRRTRARWRAASRRSATSPTRPSCAIGKPSAVTVYARRREGRRCPTARPHVADAHADGRVGPQRSHATAEQEDHMAKDQSFDVVSAGRHAGGRQRGPADPRSSCSATTSRTPVDDRARQAGADRSRSHAPSDFVAQAGHRRARTPSSCAARSTSRPSRWGKDEAASGGTVRIVGTIVNGIEAELARKINKDDPRPEVQGQGADRGRQAARVLAPAATSCRRSSRSSRSRTTASRSSSRTTGRRRARSQPIAPVDRVRHPRLPQERGRHRPHDGGRRGLGVRGWPTTPTTPTSSS